MTTEEKYLAWRRHRCAIHVGPDFAENVMQRIRAADGHGRQTGRDARRIVDWIGGRPWAQAAIIMLTTAAALVQGAFLLRIGIG